MNTVRLVFIFYEYVGYKSSEYSSLVIAWWAVEDIYTTQTSQSWNPRDKWLYCNDVLSCIKHTKKGKGPGVWQWTCLFKGLCPRIFSVSLSSSISVSRAPGSPRSPRAFVWLQNFRTFCWLPLSESRGRCHVLWCHVAGKQSLDLVWFCCQKKPVLQTWHPFPHAPKRKFKRFKTVNGCTRAAHLKADFFGRVVESQPLLFEHICKLQKLSFFDSLVRNEIVVK